MAQGWRRFGRFTFGAAVIVAAVVAGSADVYAGDPGIDFSISKTNPTTTVVAGSSTTYTITVVNNSATTQGTVQILDLFPPALTSVTWSCAAIAASCPLAAGTGDINAVVLMPAASSITYSISATLMPSASGTLVNTATVTYSNDTNPLNNSATDTDVITHEADLSVTKTNGVTEVTAGGSTSYTIVASNAGPSSVTGARVIDTFPAGVTVDWTCAGADGGVCDNDSGSGALDELVNLPPGGTATFTVTVSVPSDATGQFINVVTIDAPDLVEDPVEGNNAATDADTLVAPTTTSTTTSTTTTTTPTTTSTAPTTTSATVAPTTSAAAVPPTPTTVAPAATASLPATGSSAAARVAPWGLAFVVIGAIAVGLAARRSPRRS